MHLIRKETHTYQNEAKQSVPSPFRTLPGKPNYDPQIFDPQYQRDSYWDDGVYELEKH